MSCAGYGWAFGFSAQKARTEWARESFRLDGLGIMLLEPQVAVKCRATLRCATDLSPIQMHHILIDAFGPQLGAPVHKALVQVLHAA